MECAPEQKTLLWFILDFTIHRRKVQCTQFDLAGNSIWYFMQSHKWLKQTEYKRDRMRSRRLSLSVRHFRPLMNLFQQN